MANTGEIATMVSTIRIIEFIGKLDHEFPQSFIVKHSDKADGTSHLRDTEGKLKKNLEGEQRLKLTSKCILKQESDLDIEIHRKHPLRRKISSLGEFSKGDPLCKVSVKFDVLWDHLVSETQEEIKSNFKVEFPNGIPGLHFWIVAEAYESDLSALDGQIKNTIKDLDDFRPIMYRLGSANDVGAMFIEFGMAVSGLNSIAKSVFSCIDVIYKHFKAQEESYREMKRMTESIRILASQMDRLKEIPKSNEMRVTIGEFPRMMEEVVDFIDKWVKSWSAKHLLVAPHKDKAIELRKKLDAFAGNFNRDLLLEVRTEQATMTQNAQTAADKRELDDLVRALGENRLPLRKSCMEGTRTSILQEIEYEIKNVDGPNVIWIRGSPGVGKSALAASIANRLVDQKRHVITFRFDRTQSTVTTNALWRTVACDLARLFPSLRQHIAQGNQGHSSSDIDRLFKSLIEVPLSALDDAIPREELPVIVIDALDECGGLRHDAPGKEDFWSLLHTIKRWIQVDHLKKLKLVITSRPDDRITFPNCISIHDIPSGHKVKPGDSASNDIRTFLQSRFDDMKMTPAWIATALDCLVPGAAGIFIWATTIANFLEDSPEVRFHILESRNGGDNVEGMDDLYSLYSTVVRASFGRISKQEVQGIISVMGAMIYAKQPLSDDVLVMLPGVKIGASDILRLFRKGLTSVIGSGAILHFHHKSFEDYLLSTSFLQALPELSAVQDQGHHERQLAVLCLKALVSPKLHFNMCNLDSSTVKNANIQATVKSTVPPLILYSSQFWVDHLIHTPFEEKMMEVVKFVMYEKFLFWLEVMSLSSNVHEGYLIMKRALSWKSVHSDNELSLFIHDALRFISAFIIPISQRAPHVYLSALPFAPEQSHVGRNFRLRFTNILTVIKGKPSQWPMVVFTAEHHDEELNNVIFSPDESAFASMSFSDMYVCDTETGHCISGPFELAGHRNACFSPDGRHILVKSNSYGVVLDIEMGEEQFEIKGSDFAFIHDDQKIASTHWVDENGNLNNSNPHLIQDEHPRLTRLLVKFWDASNGTLIPNKLLEVDDVAVTRFSSDGHFLAVGRKSEDVIELWNLEDGKDPRRFVHPSGKLSSLRFSPTSDTLMAVSGKKPCHIYLWRLDTQEMVSFSRDFYYAPHVIHSPLTNYLFIQKTYTVEIWNVSTTDSKMIWETKPPATSRVYRICPSHDGHRLLVGCEDGSVRMWNMDLENLTRNQVDTQNDTDKGQVITISHSGKMMVTKSQRYHDVLDTTAGEVILRMDIEYKDYVAIAFSPYEDQVAFLSESLVTVCDIMHPKDVSFDPWQRKDFQDRKVAFQTCNDLVICAALRDEGSIFLQVWRRQDPSGFKCIYSLDLKAGGYPFILLAPNGLTIVTLHSNLARCYKWNHKTAQFDPVHFDDQVVIDWTYSPRYSPDGKLLAYWSETDSYVHVWDPRTGQFISEFPTSEVDEIALSPALIDHPYSDRLIALRLKHENAIRLLDAYSGNLYAQILGPADVHMAFIRDGTALAYYFPDFGLRIWDIADLMDEHQHSAHGYELMMKGVTNGWVMGQDDEPLFWVPAEHREHLYVPPFKVVIEGSQITILDFSEARLGRRWTECIDKGWLRELKQKEKEVGKLLE